MADYNKNDFIIQYPGIYTEREKPLLEAYLAECERINCRGEIDVKALVDGTIDPNTPGLGPVVPVTENMIRYNNEKYEQENPLYNDRDYAKRAGYADIPAYFTFGAHDDSYTAPYPPEARDTLLVSQISHRVDNLAPIYAGDTLYMVHDNRTIIDLTPDEGAVHRTLAIHGEGSIYNQKGEKVNTVEFNCTESVRIFKEGKKPEIMGFPEVWEAPDWNSKEDHFYTDEDYEWMKQVWKQEEIRGAEPRFWEDVKIGDRPTPNLEGPIVDSVLPTAPYGMGIGGTRTTKREILDEKMFKTMIKSPDHGIYVLPDKKDYTPAVPDNVQVEMLFDDGRRTDEETDSSVDTADIHSTEGDMRAAIINFFGRDAAIHHINNWMGDAGKITTIRWSIMCPETHRAFGKEVPDNPYFVHYISQLPSMEGKVMNTHGMTRDIAYIQSEVADKYVKNGKYLVRLIWWIQDINEGIWIDGDVEVELPHREK